MLSLSRKGGKLRCDVWKGMSGFNPMAVLHIEVLDGDVPPLPTGEKMLHEKITPGTKQAALLDFLPPKLVVETTPVFLVQCLYLFGLFSACPQENVVP